MICSMVPKRYLSNVNQNETIKEDIKKYVCLRQKRQNSGVY